MDHSTSSTTGGRMTACSDTRAQQLSRRGFLGNLATGAIALGTAAMGLPNALTVRANGAAPTIPPSDTKPFMTGAEYVAMLGGAVRPTGALPTDNDYPDVKQRWVEIASGPLIESIDEGALVICPTCYFVNYPGLGCHICDIVSTLTPEDVAELVADFREEHETPADEFEREMPGKRMARAIDLHDGPDEAYFSAHALYAIALMRAQDLADNF